MKYIVGAIGLLIIVGAISFFYTTNQSIRTQSGFTDVTASAGISHTQYTHKVPPVFNMTLYMTGGAAAGDVNGDGWPDLFVTRMDAPALLYQNQKDGTFKEVARVSGIGHELQTNGAGFGDIDNDGDLDLYVTTNGPHETRFYLYINQGDGTFIEEGRERGAAIEGIDAHYGQSVAFGDFDLDGWLDIHVTEWRMDELNPNNALSNTRLLRNYGHEQPGFFTDVTKSAGVMIDDIVSREATMSGTFSFASDFSDFDNDGCPDLLIIGDFGTTRLFWNNCDGTFSDGTKDAGIGTEENGMGLAIGDWDGDGLFDFFVTSVYDPTDLCSGDLEFVCSWGSSGNRLFRNLGNRVFTDDTDVARVREGHWGWGASWIDGDNDGDLDLVMVNGINLPFTNNKTIEVAEKFKNDSMRYWQNDGLGNMKEESKTLGLTDIDGKGLLTFDYDRDGDMDLFVINNSGKPILYRNNTNIDQNNDWLQITLEGSISNKQGIGARIEIKESATSTPLVREMRAGSHFLAQDEARVQFGFGTPKAQTTPLYEIKVIWPSTKVTVLNNIERNTVVHINEAATSTAIQKQE